MTRLAWGVLLVPLTVFALARAERPEPTLGRAVAARAPLVMPVRRVGEWIWTRNDVEAFERARAVAPTVVPGMLAGTLVLDARGEPRLGLGLAPSAVATRDVALVVRFDDSLHALWEQKSPEEVAHAVGPALRERLADAEASGVRVLELQLDYDAPVRRLGAWADCVAELARGPLAGRELWVTSIPAHLEDPSYGARLAGHVRGHVVQLFDTGLWATETNVARLEAELARQPLAFRVGVGGFERRTSRGPTDHAAWIAALPRFAKLPRFAGVWLFPAGRDPQGPLTAISEVMP